MTEELPELRAADADRERVAEILRDAVAEGRLAMEEFDERLDAAYRARTYRELEPLTADLPVAAAAPAPLSLRKESAAPAPWAERIAAEGTRGSTAGVAVMGGFQRKGRWTIGRRFTAFCLMGGGEIDLREADFAGPEIVISCWAVMGGVSIVVPPGVDVEVRGLGIMGGFDSREDGVPGEPGAPRVIVGGLALLGGVGVERKLPRAEKRRLKDEQRRLKQERRRLGDHPRGELD
ncbi:DUF1707 domain-containing protein [Streptomyces angustmyceticus]|uniref:DUF1707 domain-containing protein n=1 Tax=Streptomyces angustmyceticus TaxID=285578 RepID=A0A5J4LDV6_9ACTN|nr:DUF1707 domain-containing protein [Streptomyces angustmyceticus]UAL69032.1 DUF1707 domain-containing protein [Streptomyces angustmyceticus]GES29730.1 hypothetical protein San01_22170 [Streptomyces angustmyceticus]